LVFDGTSVRTYVNGVLARTITGLSGNIIQTTGAFKIGSRSANQVSLDPLSRFNGLIDEVGIYNRALSASEILAIVNAAGAGKCPSGPPSNCAPPPAGLISWWPLEGNGADVAGSNSGTVTGNVTFVTGEVGAGMNCTGTEGVIVPDSPSVNFGPG